MKKLLIIFGSLLFVSFAGLFAFCWWLVDTLTSERNKNKTAPAREARWSNKNGKADEPIKEVLNPEISQPLNVTSDEKEK